jgi:actin-like ATPase involved in cell morphogenesis
MSDSEEIKTDYLSETSDDVPTSEIDEEERIDEYIEAVERYAQLIREVPQEDLGGIVEMVEKVFEQHYEPDDNSDIIWGVLFSTGVILLASGLRLYFL